MKDLLNKMQSLAKQIFVFLFLFIILERAGVSVVSTIISSTTVNNELINTEAENTAKEAESIKDSSLKEYWTCSLLYRVPDPLHPYKQKVHISKEEIYALLFFPSIPTPPPDFC